MSREELEKATCKELQELCKNKGIPYCTHSKKFTKSQMVEALLEAEPSASQVDDHIVVKEKETIVIERRDHSEYLDGVKPGVKVAFAESASKVNTAKVLNVSYKRKQLKVETREGAEVVVSFNDVLWVRVRGYWPCHIMDALMSEGKRNVIIK